LIIRISRSAALLSLSRILIWGKEIVYRAFVQVERLRMRLQENGGCGVRAMLRRSGGVVTITALGLCSAIPGGIAGVALMAAKN